MKSMTGFGRASRSEDPLQIAVEARSVNHRYLDLQLRLPDGWRSLEPAIRELVGGRLARGRVELSVELRDERPGAARARLDGSLVRDLLDQAVALESGSGEIGLRDVLQLPGVVRIERSSDTVDDAVRETVLEVVQEAVESLEASRSLEGAALREALEGSLDELAMRAGAVRGERESARRRLVERHRARVVELLGDLEIDEGRLAQEAAVLAERSDFEEELHRLEGHVEAFRQALSESGPVGKRLDFLAQEMHRELNTLGVKCRDLSISAQVVEGKLACDRLREQLSNVE